MTLFLWWTATAWPWLKRWGVWLLLFPVGIFLYYSGKSRGKVVVVAARKESEEARTAQEGAEASRQREEAVALEEKERKDLEILQEYQEATSTLVEEQKEAASGLLEDPESLNEYLADVGKRARQ